MFKKIKSIMLKKLEVYNKNKRYRLIKKYLYPAHVTYGGSDNYSLVK